VTTPGCPMSHATEEILAICRRTFQRPGPDGSLPRQFHRKTYACLRGRFEVEPADDRWLRQGLFANPGRYDAIVRFSSSFFDDDRLADAGGIAIKLRGVEGAVCDGAPEGQQDFVLMSAPSGPARDAEEAVHLFAALDGVARVTPLSLAAPGYVFPSLDPRRIRWRYLAFALAGAGRHLLGRDLAQLAYYSVTPYRLGQGAAKYIVRPEAAAFERRARGRGFGARLQAALDKGPIRFDFLLQPRVLDDDPIDDARRAWRSPAIRVGRIEIPPQDVAASVALGDALTFSPWNCLEAHAPLGSINEVRRHAYRASADARGAEAAFPADGEPRAPSTR